MNFALGMLLLLAVTGGVWLLDRFLLRQRREAAVRAALARAESQAGPQAGRVASRISGSA